MQARAEALNARRRFLALAAAAAGGLAASCGVKGPLYLPEDSEDERDKGTDKDKDKDDEKVSTRAPAPHAPGHG